MPHFSDAYQEKDIVYRWHKKPRRSAFEVPNKEGLDLPSFELTDVILDEGSKKYAIGK